MLETGIRHAATVLMESAIRIAPPDAREWGRAMRGELDYVEGPWATGMWALGGTSVLMKQTLISLVIPGRSGQGMVPDGGLFARSATLRRASLSIGAACVLAALLFFAAPPFRQAFDVALRPWRVALHAGSGNLQPELGRLAERAEAQHDAEGLAFCAVRLQDSRQSARLAEEAVRLDPNLVWVYAVVAMRDPGIPLEGDWLRKLEAWDSQNAALYLIAAEAAQRAHYDGPPRTPPADALEPGWQNSMAAAFRSAKFDDYLDRIVALNRRVVTRYRFYDPYEVAARDQTNLPMHAFQNAERYANSVLEEGRILELKGSRNEARERYWTVARFGQMLDSQRHTRFEQEMGGALQLMAFHELESSSRATGNLSEAGLFRYLAEKSDAAQVQPPPSPGESAFGLETAERNAAVVQTSGLMMLLFAGFLATGGFILALSYRRGAIAVASRARPLATIVVLSSAVGLLFSSVTLYLTYRPYWYILQSALQSGERLPTNDLRYFLNQGLPGVSAHGYNVLVNALVYSGTPGFLFYFWAGATLLGLIGLILILLRHFLGRPPNSDDSARGT